MEYVPDRLKTQEICNKVIEVDPFSLQYVPDWFVTQQHVNLWHDDGEYHDDDELINWHDGYQKSKAKKAKIKKELMLLFGIHQDGTIGVFLKKRKKIRKNCRSNTLMWLGEGIRWPAHKGQKKKKKKKKHSKKK